MKNQKSRLVIGSLSVAIAATLWSLDGVFIRPKFYQFPAALIVFWEHFLGFLVLSPFLIKGRKALTSMLLQDWISILWVCLFGGLIGTLFITKAFFAAFAGSVSFSTVIILQKLQPVFALFIARLILKEKLTKRFYLWAVLAIISAYLIGFGKNGINITKLNFLHSAAFFALIAAFAFGSSTVFGKKIVTDIDFKTATALRFGLTSILALVFIVVSKDIYATSTLSSIHWGFLIVIVFTSGAVALFIYYYGLKRIPASFATLFELFWPITAIVMDYFINKNSLSLVQISATMILLFSLYKILGLKGRSS